LRVYTEHNEFSEWVQILPKPGKYVHPQYGELDLDKQAINRILKNFKELNYQSKLPIDTEHDEGRLKTQGAFGWIEDLRQATDGSVEAHVDWTDLGREAIANKRFRYMSADILPKFIDPDGNEHKDVLRGAALCVRPFFKDKYMRPILATEDAVYAVSDELPEAGYQRMFRDRDGNYYFTQYEPVGDEPTRLKEVTMSDKDTSAVKAGMSEEEAKKLSEMEATVQTLTEANATLKTANEQMSTKLSEAETNNKQLSERVTAMEKEARKTRFEKTAADFVGKTEDHVKFMEFIADKDEKGEESEQLKAYVERERAIAEQVKASNLFSEFGHDKTGDAVTAEAKLDAEAKKIQAAEPTLSYAQAYAKVMEQQPKLYAEYLEENGRAS
jgi:hypothetical protein